MEVEFNPLLFSRLKLGSHILRAPSFEQTVLVNKKGFDPESLVELQFKLEEDRANIALGSAALLQVNNVHFKYFMSLNAANNAFVEPVPSVELQRDRDGYWLAEDPDAIQNAETFERFVNLINEHAPHIK